MVVKQIDVKSTKFACKKTYCRQVDKVQIFKKGHKNLFHLPLIVLSNHVMSEKERMMGQIFVALSEYLNLKAGARGASAIASARVAFVSVFVL